MQFIGWNVLQIKTIFVFESGERKRKRKGRRRNGDKRRKSSFRHETKNRDTLHSLAYFSAGEIIRAEGWWRSMVDHMPRDASSPRIITRDATVPSGVGAS